jgi:ribosomal protein S7
MNKSQLKNSKQHFFFKIILQFFLKEGSLKTAEKQMMRFFKTLFLKTSLGNYSIFLKIYKTLYINFEIKSIKKHKTVHMVPIPVSKKRRYFIITKWLFDSALKDRQRISIVSKLITEVIKYIENQQPESLIKKKFCETTALQYRSNIHFRWY